MLDMREVMISFLLGDGSGDQAERITMINSTKVARFGAGDLSTFGGKPRARTMMESWFCVFGGGTSRRERCTARLGGRRLRIGLLIFFWREILKFYQSAFGGCSTQVAPFPP